MIGRVQYRYFSILICLLGILFCSVSCTKPELNLAERGDCEMHCWQNLDLSSLSQPQLILALAEMPFFDAEKQLPDDLAVQGSLDYVDGGSFPFSIYSVLFSDKEDVIGWGTFIFQDERFEQLTINFGEKAYIESDYAPTIREAIDEFGVTEYVLERETGYYRIYRFFSVEENYYFTVQQKMIDNEFPALTYQTKISSMTITSHGTVGFLVKDIQTLYPENIQEFWKVELPDGD